MYIALPIQGGLSRPDFTPTFPHTQQPNTKNRSLLIKVPQVKTFLNFIFPCHVFSTYVVKLLLFHFVSYMFSLSVKVCLIHQLRVRGMFSKLLPTVFLREEAVSCFLFTELIEGNTIWSAADFNHYLNFQIISNI